LLSGLSVFEGTGEMNMRGNICVMLVAVRLQVN